MQPNDGAINPVQHNNRERVMKRKFNILWFSVSIAFCLSLHLFALQEENISAYHGVCTISSRMKGSKWGDSGFCGTNVSRCISLDLSTGCNGKNFFGFAFDEPYYPGQYILASDFLGYKSVRLLSADDMEIAGLLFERFEEARPRDTSCAKEVANMVQALKGSGHVSMQVLSDAASVKATIYEGEFKMVLSMLELSLNGSNFISHVLYVRPRIHRRDKNPSEEITIDVCFPDDPHQ